MVIFLVCVFKSIEVSPIIARVVVKLRTDLLRPYRFERGTIPAYPFSVSPLVSTKRVSSTCQPRGFTLTYPIKGNMVLSIIRQLFFSQKFELLVVSRGHLYFKGYEQTSIKSHHVLAERELPKLVPHRWIIWRLKYWHKRLTFQCFWIGNAHQCVESRVYVDELSQH